MRWRLIAVRSVGWVGMGFIGKLFGSHRDRRSRESDLGGALEAAGIDASHDRWSGWMFRDTGRGIFLDAGDGSYVDVRVEQREGTIGAGPDAPVIWNEDPRGAREAWVDDDGAPLPDLLLDRMAPALSPIVDAGAHSIRVSGR